MLPDRGKELWAQSPRDFSKLDSASIPKFRVSLLSRGLQATDRCHMDPRAVRTLKGPT